MIAETFGRLVADSSLPPSTDDTSVAASACMSGLSEVHKAFVDRHLPGPHCGAWVPWGEGAYSFSFLCPDGALHQAPLPELRSLSTGASWTSQRPLTMQAGSAMPVPPVDGGGDLLTADQQNFEGVLPPVFGAALRVRVVFRQDSGETAASGVLLRCMRRGGGGVAPGGRPDGGTLAVAAVVVDWQQSTLEVTRPGQACRGRGLELQTSNPSHAVRGVAVFAAKHARTSVSVCLTASAGVVPGRPCKRGLRAKQRGSAGGRWDKAPSWAAHGRGHFPGPLSLGGATLSCR
jgi:hypothetical protein